jgi:YVTN family beta-propeller protein
MRVLSLPATLLLTAASALSLLAGVGGTDDHQRLKDPSQSGPIQITPDDRYVWVANPDVNTVSRIEVRDDGARDVVEVPVGKEPQNVAISPDGRFVYVSNTVSGTVSVIRNVRRHPRVVRTVRVGTEPYGMAFTPNGTKLYVANARSNDVSVLNLTEHGRWGDRRDDDDDGESSEVETIEGVGLEPRGIAITNDGDGRDGDEKVYVTQFLAVDRPGVTIGADDYKEGRVTVISAANDKVIGEVVLNPMTETGFLSNGSALRHIAPTTPPTFTVTTGAFPNQFNSVVIKGARAYLPSTAASPDGPQRFNVNVQSMLSVVDLSTDTEGESGGARQTLNMNRGINFEPAGENKLFIAVPWAAAFERRSNEGYVVSAGANLLVKVILDANGTPTINAPTGAGQPSGVVRIKVGQNPKGIVINSRDDRAYVMNEISRDVSIVNLETDQVIATVPTSDLPAAGSDQAKLLLGKALFHTAAGVNLPQLGPLGVVPANRVSADAWSGCVSCHPFGLTDGVVWIFGSGPRRSSPLSWSFNPRDPSDMKILNHSAIFDEIQDFENNMRNNQGGQGLITLADGVTPDPVLNAFNLPNTGRSLHHDLIALFVARGIRTPISPLASAEGRDRRQIRHGRELFGQLNCASCHGGGGWASSRRDYTPPPNPADVVGGQIVRLLKKVGTFDPTAVNEIRENGTPSRGADGFNPPSLLGAHALAPYLRNGSAATLDQVMSLVPHRSAGTGGVDGLTDPQDRADLVSFLQSIDASTRPFDIPGPVAVDLAFESTRPGESFPLKLERVSPNPLTTQTTITYSLPSEGPVRLEVYDLLGRRVATLVDRMQGAGRHEVSWDRRTDGGGRASFGIYFARLAAIGGATRTKLVIAQ